ncbi:MAG: carboxypeptidase regulatory-like domain-containing protein, partial [Candidatus Acidiferrales bacterium]
MRRPFPFAALVFFAILTFPAPGRAQVSAAISGRVTDPSGAIVSGANVTATNIETGETRSAATDAEGRYSILALPVGAYEIHVTKASFQEQVQTGIHLAVGQAASADFALRLGQVAEQVKVQADAPMVSVAPADVSGLVGERQVKNLPLNGRSYDELMTLDPGVVNFTSEKVGGIGVSNSTVGNNFSVSGNRPQQNLYLLNGVEFTGAAENNMQPGGTSQQLLGVDAVREFNLLRDSYGAEYGKRPGAQVLIVTQSGSNRFHGSVYEFLRNSALDASNYFDRGSTPPFQRDEFGGSLGGPIQKDRTFFFANYEGFRQNLHQTGVGFVPDASARNGTFVPLGSGCPVASQAACAAAVTSLLNSWPVANGPDQGSGIAQYFSDPLQTIRDDFGTARVDRIVSQADTFSAIYTVDDSSDVTPTAANPYSTDLESLREQVFSVEETHVFSPTLLNTARFGYSRASYFYTGEPTPGTPAAALPGFVETHPVGAVVVGGSAAANPAAQIGLAGSNIGSNLNIARNLFTYADTATLTRGRNEFKFGVWFQQVRPNEDLALSQFGQATFTSLTQFLQGTIGTFLYDPAPTEMNWRSLLGAWFVEDTIRVSPKLTVSLGFRDEFTTGWNEAHGRAANFVFNNGVIQTQPQVGNSALTANNAKFLPLPRVGIAWSPLGPKTVIRAGFGMYDDLQDALGYRMDQNA